MTNKDEIIKQYESEKCRKIVRKRWDNLSPEERKEQMKKVNEKNPNHIKHKLSPPLD